MVIILLILLLFAQNITYPQAFRIDRPAKDSFQINGSYLYGEPRFWDPANAHRGVDIIIDHDTVYSVSEGQVYFIGYDPNNDDGYEPAGCGNYIFVKSEWNNKDAYFLYCHLSKPLVSDNQQLVGGEPIGISGNTGNSTGPHLHFEIRIGSPSPGAVRSRRNPELWFAIEGTGAIYGSIEGAPDETRIDISPDPKPRPPYTTFGWALTYKFADPTVGSDDFYNENYAIGDVKPGAYVITALNGSYRREVFVEAGKITNADITTSLQEESIHADFRLHQNYPNPFNPTTTILYAIPVGDAKIASHTIVKLKVYDILGNEVATLVDERQASGTYEVQFDVNSMKQHIASGMYIYKIVIGEKYISAKK